MILVDSSVWIEFLRGTGSEADRTMARLLEGEAELACTPQIALELLAGLPEEEDREELFAHLLTFEILLPSWPTTWRRAAELRHAARPKALPLADCLVAAVALEAGALLLHRDRDFEALAGVSPLEAQRV